LSVVPATNFSKGGSKFMAGFQDDPTVKAFGFRVLGLGEEILDAIKKLATKLREVCRDDDVQKTDSEWILAVSKLSNTARTRNRLLVSPDPAVTPSDHSSDDDDDGDGDDNDNDGNVSIVTPRNAAKNPAPNVQKKRRLPLSNETRSPKKQKPMTAEKIAETVKVAAAAEHINDDNIEHQDNDADDEEDDDQSDDADAKTACRVCGKPVTWKETTVLLQDDATKTSHPEKYWNDDCDKQTISQARDHDKEHHAHWPLWNSIRKWTKPIPDGVEVADFVFYQALEHAAKQIPHELHERYENVEAFTTVMNWRVGAAIHFASGGKMIWTGKWWTGYLKRINITGMDASKKVRKEIGAAATALVRHYGLTLSEVVRASWDKILPLTHQQKVDLYQDVFLTRYCIDAVRDSRKLFPPVVVVEE
jgi:hypothetical protein